MDLEDMHALSNVLCSDESNESNQVLIDLANLSHGVIVDDKTSVYYNTYLFPDFGGEHHGKHHPQLAATMFDFEKEPS